VVKIWDKHIIKRIYNKNQNKSAIIKACNVGIKQFRHDHPDMLDGSWQMSLAKRIAGNIYNWLYNNQGG